LNIKQHLKIELFGFSMDALTAATILDQEHSVHEVIDHGHGAHEVIDQGHGAMDNLDERKLLIKDMVSMMGRILTKSQLPMAYFLVQSLAFLSASASLAFHSSATSFANGSSGLGAERRAWMERRTVLI